MLPLHRLWDAAVMSQNQPKTHSSAHSVNPRSTLSNSLSSLHCWFKFAIVGNSIVLPPGNHGPTQLSCVSFYKSSLWLKKPASVYVVPPCLGSFSDVCTIPTRPLFPRLCFLTMYPLTPCRVPWRKCFNTRKCIMWRKNTHTHPSECPCFR